jgi:hypothetical protein
VQGSGLPFEAGPSRTRSSQTADAAVAGVGSALECLRFRGVGVGGLGLGVQRRWKTLAAASSKLTAHNFGKLAAEDFGKLTADNFEWTLLPGTGGSARPLGGLREFYWDEISTVT